MWWMKCEAAKDLPPNNTRSFCALKSLAMTERKDERTGHSSDTERGASAKESLLGDSKEWIKPTLDLLCGDILCQFEVGLYEYMQN